jgi:ATP-dependent Lhr-like helicase
MYAHALAQTLLDRYGILTKGAVAAERISGGFAAVYPVLRAMEEAGRARRGYFVEGLGAAQFAVPGAVDRMRALAQPRSDREDQVSSVTRGRPAPYGAAAYGGRAAGGDGVSAELWEYERDVAGGTDGAADAGGPEGSGGSGASNRPGASGAGGSGGRGGADQRAQVIVLAAADPANAYGASLAWPSRPDETAAGHRPGRKAGALVILADGELVLYVERGGRTLLSWTDDPQQLGPATAALAAAVRAGALGRLTVERADGGGVYDSPLAKALEEAGFRPTPKGLRLRG